MKIKIPAYEPVSKAYAHLRHGPIELDLGEDIVMVVRCKDCVYRGTRQRCDGRKPDYYCADGVQRSKVSMEIRREQHETDL